MATDTQYLQNLGPLNQLQYATKDFPSYFDALLRRLREQYGAEYNDFGSSSTGMLLTHITAYGLAQLSWYLDRSVNDCYLETARTLSTVTKLARQIGYKPTPATASTADLLLTFAATAAPSTIAAGFRFQGPSNLTYSATAAVIVPSGSTTAVVNVTEGVQQVLNFTGTGDANQTYNLTGVNTGQYVADTSVRVFVDGLEWTENDFITFDATNQFDVSYTTTPPTVTFGDGFAGNIPALGSTIQIRYRIINGAAGNVKAGTITTATDTFIVAGNPVTLTVNNAQGSSGGAEPESVQRIKLNAPRYYLSRGAAITQGDYIALTQAFADPTYGSVSVAYADVIRDAGLDATTQAILQSLSLSIDTFNTAFALQQANLTAAFATINTANTALAAEFAVIAALNADIATSNTTLQSYLALGTNNAATTTGLANLIVSNAASAIADIAAGSYTQASTTVGVISSLATDILNSNGIVSGVFTVLKGELQTQAELIASEAASIATAQATSTTITTATATGATSVAAIAAAGAALEAEVDAETAALSAHLAGLFSSDCKANLVNVPILVTDSTGFYTGPSSGLINAVQGYLDGIKDVTHEVRVVSGSPLLLAANINAFVSIGFGFVVSEVLSNIEFGFDDLLRARDFAAPLYLSDLYAIANNVAGVSSITIEITGPTSRLDAYGNLVPQALEIITKGTVNITQV